MSLKNNYENCLILLHIGEYNYKADRVSVGVHRAKPPVWFREQSPKFGPESEVPSLVQRAKPQVWSRERSTKFGPESEAPSLVQRAKPHVYSRERSPQLGPEVAKFLVRTS